MISRLQILNIDDNEGDSLVLEKGFANSKRVAFQHVRSFSEGLAVLHARPEKDRVNLIILDWHLPAIDGFKALSILKGGEATRPIPVIVMTGDILPATRVEAYRAGASCVILKPLDLTPFLGLATAIECFWLQIAELPFGVIDNAASDDGSR